MDEMTLSDLEINTNEAKTSILEKQLRATDPKDYYRISTFQKHAQLIDPDPSHPWESSISNYTWSSNLQSEFTIAIIYEQDKKQNSLLFAAQDKDKGPISGYVTDLSPTSRDIVYEILGVVVRRFPTAKKYEFIKNVINEASRLREISTDSVAAKLATMALDLLSDDPLSAPLTQDIELPKVSYGQSEPTEQQRAELMHFFNALATKIPKDALNQSLLIFIRDIPFTDHIYGRNFQFIYTDVLGWLVANRQDTKIDGANMKRTEKTATFPVNDLVRNKVSSDDDLRLALSKMPVKDEPDTRHLKHGLKTVEFVELNKLVGGPGITDWSVISASEGRGFDRVKQIAENFQKENMDIAGHNEPIQVEELDDYYYIGQDGRHRVAALKALGVLFVPMFVTHIERE